MRSLLLAASLLAALTVATVAHAQPQDLRATAAAKLARGGLQRWERNWWQKIAAGTIAPKAVTVWQTQYGGYEGFGGDVYHIAANPRYMAKGTVVYLPSTGRLMVVTNRGADFNDRIAQRRGAAFWVDRFERKRGTYRTGVGTCWIVGKAPWPH